MPEPTVDSSPPAEKLTCHCGEVHAKGRPRITPTSEHTRLVEVYCCPELRAPLSQHLQGDERPALDDGTGRRRTFWMHVAEVFNQPAVVFEPYQDEHTSPDGVRARKLDCRLVHFRDAEYLQAQWASLIKTVTEHFASWTKSGQQDPSNFWSFCNGDRVSYYTMQRLWKANLLHAASCNVVPADEAYDAGVQPPPDGGGTGVESPLNNPASGSQGVKRRKVAKGKARVSTNTSTNSDTPWQSSKTTVSKLDLMSEKFASDKRRKDAAFAAEILQNASMPPQVTKAAERMLLRFFNCSDLGQETRGSVVEVESGSDSD